MHLRLTLIFLALSYIFALNPLSGQDPMRIGEWDTYLPKREGLSVAQSTDKIYYSTGRTIVVFDKTDLSHKEINKQDGLAETLIKFLKYDEFNNQLIVVYTSGNIDVVTSKGVFNVPFIKENRTIVGRKSVNDLHIADANIAYIATDFGVIEWDLKSLEFKATIFTNEPVSNVIVGFNKIYLSLSDGIYTINKNDIRRINFGTWQVLSTSSGLPIVYTTKDVVIFDNKLFLALDDRLYRTTDGQSFTIMTNITRPVGFSIKFISGDRTHLILGWRNTGNDAIIQAMTKEGQILPAGGGCGNRSIYAIQDESQRIWIADEWRGLRHTTKGLNDGCERTELNSPFSFTASDIEVKKNKVYFASGGANEDLGPLSVRSGIYILDSNRWDNIVGAFIPQLEASDYHNFYNIALHPTKDIVYAASFYSGLMAYQPTTKKFTFYNSGNAPISPTLPWIADVRFDRDANLWATHTNAEKSILCLTKDSIWYSFKPPINSKALGRMTIDARGYKWIQVAGNPSGVLVYDSGARIEDPSDDRYKYFDANNSVIKGNKIFALQADKDGRIWVGTSEGPVLFDCNPFDESCKGTLRKVLQDSIPAILLATEEILSIAFDGGNRKWFGTRNGIYVQNADADKQIAQYNTENSPLTDNAIYAMTFDDASGKMYIGTGQGMHVLQTETFGAKKEHSSDVYAFPNPVRPGYTGPISIRGLGRDANVKITDISGRLVYETKALGGQANWDGKDYNGRAAAPGVYLVFSASQVSFESVDSYVTKLMIIGN